MKVKHYWSKLCSFDYDNEVDCEIHMGLESNILNDEAVKYMKFLCGSNLFKK